MKQSMSVLFMLTLPGAVLVMLGHTAIAAAFVAGFVIGGSNVWLWTWWMEQER